MFIGPTPQGAISGLVKPLCNENTPIFISDDLLFPALESERFVERPSTRRPLPFQKQDPRGGSCQHGRGELEQG